MKGLVWLLGALMLNVASADGSGQTAGPQPSLLNATGTVLEVSACAGRRCLPWRILSPGQTWHLPLDHPTVLSMSEKPGTATDFLLMGVRPGSRLKLVRRASGLELRTVTSLPVLRRRP